MIPTARNIPPTQPSARQDALYPERGPSNSLYLPLGEWPRLPSTARIERAPADSPTSQEGVGRLFFTARIERPLLYRGGSASKKNGLPAPSHLSEAARCASTGIVPATPSPLFQHPVSSNACQRPVVSRTIVPFSPLAQPCVPSGNERPNSETFAIAPCSVQVKPLSVVR
jgi:hypothetical protein